MFSARWCIETKFGHKEAALMACKRWQEEIGERVGMKRSNTRVLTGSIGVSESRLEFDTQFTSLAELEKAFIEMAKLPAHKKFAEELEKHIVSGTNRWKIYRTVDW
jgi:hypothetical protein